MAYRAGLRLSEITNLKMSDIDSKRMLLRIEQGKGQKDRNGMLSPRLLEMLREWWLIGQPTTWLFPGRDPLMPPSTRQIYRAVRNTAADIGIKKRVSPHTLRHSSADIHAQGAGRDRRDRARRAGRRGKWAVCLHARRSGEDLRGAVRQEHASLVARTAAGEARPVATEDAADPSRNGPCRRGGS